MAAIRIENFAGLIPRLSPRLLPPNAAAIAQNAKLTTGEGKGFRAPRQIADFTGLPFNVRRAYRIPDLYGDLWLTFSSPNVDVVRSPIINDAHDRYYIAGDGRPKYNTIDRIRNGDPPYLLGVPAPNAAPTLTPPVGSDTTRAYVYTFVSAYGEEGQPSPPVIDTGAFGTWQLTSLATTVPDASQRNITHKRIYRTIPGESSAAFFFVAEIPLNQSSYNDSASDEVVARNNLLESATWAEPPSDMEGFVVMPNGYLVGWAGRRLLFSEPYRPHAWPAEYELSTEYEIVALAVWNDMVVIGTRSNPYIGQGVSPSSFTTRKIDVIEPCMARRGMVVASVGVLYPSPNGLMLVNASGPAQLTENIMTKEEWERYTDPGMVAAQYGLLYIAFTTPALGFVFNPTEEQSKFVELDRFSAVQGLETDRYTGTVTLINQRRAWEWDPPSSERLFWRWRSKVFHVVKPINIGAAKIKFDTPALDLTEDTEAYYKPYNVARFAVGVADANLGPPLLGSLNTLNGHALHAVQGPDLVPDWTEPENRGPLGGSLLYPLNIKASQISAVRLRVFANGHSVFDGVVYDEDIIRLPAGFKTDIWQIEISANTTVYSIQLGATGKALEAA